MRFFFIDLENVRSEGLEGVSSLNDSDTVFIYYSENAMNLSIPTLENLNSSRASKKFIKTNYIGKNAMDFQIVSLFGAMIERNRQGSYYIISQDNGFRSAVSFCESYFEDYGIKCGVYPTIISAITAEMKNSLKKNGSDRGRQKNGGSGQGQKANAKNPATGGSEGSPAAVTGEEQQETAAAPGQDRKRKRRRKPNSQAQVTASDVEAAGQAEENVSEAAPGQVKSEEAEYPKAADSSEGSVPEAAEAQPAAEEQATDRFAYIYSTLGSLLSQKTISLYAEAIDEAVAGCRNRDELHEFFRERFGDDEGEALYKVTQGDFENMKQARPKRSQGHRRRSRRH